MIDMFLTLQQVAAELEIHPQTVMRILHREELPYERMGHTNFVVIYRGILPMIARGNKWKRRKPKSNNNVKGN